MSRSMPRVLYIDDDQGLCLVVKRDLERNGYSMDMAHDGISGLARIGAERFDAIILDHHMPGRDGLSILGEIAKLDDPPPVVYVTGEAEGKVAVAALKAGAEEYVIKEASADFLPLLRAGVAGAIEQREIRRAHAAAEAEVREARDRFESLAKEREVLIREINHRIGNSLQLVNAFLRLQAGAASQPETKTALSNAQVRVNAIGHVHRQLYTGSDVREIDLGRYLEDLVIDLRKALGTETGAHLSVAAEPILTTTDRAVSIGMMVTELVLNATKYAYPQGQHGPVRVVCRALPGGGLELVVEDDGVGMDPAAPAKGGGLGQKIVGMMSTKLKAETSRDQAHKGVRTVIRIPEAPPG
ncbi:response regulator [Dongia sp.]|uniref:response regulator n=1 Tax=Dongia sp. TaxID=1977262 RepID=UPI00375137D5